jgi:catechol 2,3-dioxygenase-like lactoylglutathione lyase family enzyme
MKTISLVLWVQDATLSVKFYKKLGFSVAQTDGRNATVSLDGFQMMLVTMRDEDEFNHDSLAADKGRGMYVYIHAEDVDAQHTQLQQAGLAPATEPRDWPWAHREFVIKDPDGYKVCFWQETKKKI